MYKCTQFKELNDGDMISKDHIKDKMIVQQIDSAVEEIEV